MKKTLQKLFIAVIFTGLTSLIASAQPGPGIGYGSMPPSGTLKGKILDKQSGDPVEYASIVVIKLRDSSIITGGITNTSGEFLLEKIPYGRYKVQVKFIGYSQWENTNITVSPKAKDVDLGTINITVASQAMEGVTVSGRKEMMTHSLDKKVINVDKDLASVGGTALDVMQSVPSVTVDFDGNISLRGSTNVNILIDGKPSQMTSLDQLPAAMIESIEVVTNPSVKYDPDGMAGIINIVLKKQKIVGTNGMVSLTAGNNNRYMGSVNLNFKRDNWNIFTNVDFRSFNFDGYSNSYSKSYLSDIPYIKNTTDFTRKMTFGGVRLGADYNINPKNTITLSTWLNTRKFSGNEDLVSSSYDSALNVVDFYKQNRTTSNNDGFESEFTLSYKKDFNVKGRTLTADAFFSNGPETSSSMRRKDFYTSAGVLTNQYPELEKTDTKEPGTRFTIQSDYVSPIGNGGRLESGVKAILRSDNSDYLVWEGDSTTQSWIVNQTYSNNFIYKEHIYSGYASYSNTWGKLSYMGGVRLEQSLSKSEQKTTDSTFNKNIFSVFPSLHLSFEVATGHDLIFSYSRRINRPRSRVINPFLVKQDANNVSYGNPNINPEYVNSYEVGYGFKKVKTNITTTFFYRQTTDVIAQKVTLVNDIFETTYDNLNSSVNYGVEVVASSPIFKWWRINGSYSYFHAEINGAGVTSDAKSSNSWTAKIASVVFLPKGIEFQQNFNYRSPIVTSGTGGRGFSAGGQGIMARMWSLDLGLKKNFLKNKATITARVSDVFKTTTFNSTTYGDNFETNYERGRNSRMFFIGLSYKINDYRRSSKKPDQSPDDNSLDDF